ncbi:hypothetical protein C1X35_14290 [Pseudomonas sp. FW306-1C-G01A]|nr:hypothetical protein C1X56_03245 [Pseudomonas sp. GW101-1A09]PMV99424.1 hypothetical protein C1X51_00315 [Pseudomonas sp. FW306-2-2C-B10A]PMW03509.1 hypothetical protein C1X50_21960 [Pseudomonas sp. MPR-TSA4]PMW16771.1 hypothetical protein C1X52_11355 [Pseudomonas sp. FW306-2-1A-C05A]PMW19926.1 hypothetical protein C1X40_12375 [Pseudomonas sp. GW456-11-11-14-TSB2]PMW26473.1 hypothetical protein C1X53_02175 [Pseudomonas sp. GW456-E6]PMW34892.1 hypothetical protein C1X45_18250 [Pseudomonas s
MSEGEGRVAVRAFVANLVDVGEVRHQANVLVVLGGVPILATAPLPLITKIINTGCDFEY